MDQWAVAGIALLGVVGQWWVGSRASARRDGVVDEKLLSHDRRLEKHGEELDEVRSELAGHGREIAGMQARLPVAPHHRG